MQAFHNDPAIKAKYLERVAAHRHLDQLVQGTGWESDRGCAVGCTLDAYDHARLVPSVAHLFQFVKVVDDLIRREKHEWPTYVAANGN